MGHGTSGTVSRVRVRMCGALVALFSIVRIELGPAPRVKLHEQDESAMSIKWSLHCNIKCPVQAPWLWRDIDGVQIADGSSRASAPGGAPLQRCATPQHAGSDYLGVNRCASRGVELACEPARRWLRRRRLRIVRTGGGSGV